MLAARVWMCFVRVEREQVTQAAMESTGVYWKPVFNMLESSCEVVLVNSRQVRNVP